MHVMGELVVHRTHVESLAHARASPGPAARDAGPHAQLAGAADDGHAGADDPRRGGVPALPAARPRPLVEARQEGRARAHRRRTPSSTAPSSTPSATRSCTSSATRSTTASSRPRSASRPASRRAGTLEISARHAGGSVVITVRDDGRGIDPGARRRKAVERGLIAADAVDSVDLPRAVELLFTPGFSTAETTSDISGRGVGMDAVRATIRELGGEVLVQSELGVGHDRPDPPAADARDHVRAARRGRRHALRDPARPRRADADAQRPDRALRRGRADARARATASCRWSISPTRFGYPRRRGAALAVIVRSGDQRLALAVDAARRPARARHPPAARRASATRAAFSGGAVLSNGPIALIVDCDALGAPRRPRARRSIPAAA